MRERMKCVVNSEKVKGERWDFVHSFGFGIYGFGLNTMNVCINVLSAHR